jgi:hypothetical protein
MCKNKQEIFLLLLQRTERRLPDKSTFLSYEEQLMLMKLVFSSLKTFSCAPWLPLSNIEQINKYSRHYFWRKYAMENKLLGIKLAFLMSKEVRSLKHYCTHNKFLLMKNNINYIKKEDISRLSLCVSLTIKCPSVTKVECSSWWKSHIKLIEIYKHHALCKIINGKSILFWADNW